VDNFTSFGDSRSIFDLGFGIFDWKLFDLGFELFNCRLFDLGFETEDYAIFDLGFEITPFPPEEFVFNEPLSTQ
jgi:hypothetical protein